MKLTPKQKTELTKKLKFLINNKCSICGSKKWVVNDIIFELKEFRRGKLAIGGKLIILPVISVICGNCANTILFNALMLGILKKETKNGQE